MSFFSALKGLVESLDASPTGRQLVTFTIVGAWMLLSMLIIVFNKWILDRYPFPMILTTWHMLCATMATQFLANFTTLVDDRKKSKMTLAIYFKAIIPIGLCFSLSLWFGNMAYLYLSMSFIQMLKALAPVVTLLCCWSVGLRNPEPSMRILATVSVIVVGVVMTSIGDMEFQTTGVIVQLAAVVFEAYKMALQQVLLDGENSLSSMGLLYYFSPACTVAQTIFILIFGRASLHFTELGKVGFPMFLINGLLTFLLNVSSVTVIKRTSSVVLTLCGIPRAAILVVFDMFVHHTIIGAWEAVGFSVAGAGTYQYARLTQKESAQDQGSPVPLRDGDEESLVDVYDEKNKGILAGEVIRPSIELKPLPFPRIEVAETDEKAKEG